MTALVGQLFAGASAMRTERGLNQNDDVIVEDPSFRFTKNQTREGIEFPHADYLWPRPSVLGGYGQDGITAGGGGILQSANQSWEWNIIQTSNSTRKMFSGTVINAGGAPVSGATVNLFNTATGLLVDTTTSASDGTYILGDTNNVACFVVAYLTGSPDTFGTTKATLTGS